MDAIHSWIDKDEVSRLAEKLSASPERMKDWKKLESDGFAIPEKQGEQVGVSNIEAEKSLEPTPDEAATPIPEKALDQQRSILAGASQMAKSAGLIHSEKQPAILEEIKTQQSEKVLEQIETTEVETPSATINVETGSTPKGTFVLVQELFNREVDDAGLCIIDRDGDVLYDSFENLSLTHFTANVMKSSSLMQVDEQDVGSLRIKQSASEVIEFISVKCSRGVVLVAAKLKEGLSVDQRLKLAPSLRQILNVS